MGPDRDKMSPLDILCYDYLKGGPGEAPMRKDLAKRGETILPPLINALLKKRREAHDSLVPPNHDIHEYDDELDWEARDALEPSVQAAAKLVNVLAKQAWSNPLFSMGRSKWLNSEITNLFEGDKETKWALGLVLSEALLQSTDRPKHERSSAAKGVGLALKYTADLYDSGVPKSVYEATMLGVYLDVSRQFLGSKIAEKSLHEIAKLAGVDPETLEEAAVTRAYGYFVRME